MIDDTPMDSVRDKIDSKKSKEEKMEQVHESLNVLEKELATGDVDQHELEQAVQYLVFDIQDLRADNHDEDSIENITDFIGEIATEKSTICDAFNKIENRTMGENIV